MTSISNATRGQLSGFYRDDRPHYQALILGKAFQNSRVCQRVMTALGHLQGRQRPRPTVPQPLPLPAGDSLRQ